jgi:hypothetical protein
MSRCRRYSAGGSADAHRLYLPMDRLRTIKGTAGCADVDPRMSCMHYRLIRLFGGAVCMRHAIRVNHIEIRCIPHTRVNKGERMSRWGNTGRDEGSVPIMGINSA